LAAKGGHKDLVKALIDCGANMELMDEDGRTAMYWAYREDYTGIAQVLVEAGAKLDFQMDNDDSYDEDRNRESPLLMWASKEGAVGLVRALIKAGADLNSKDKRGMTALIHAVKTAGRQVEEMDEGMSEDRRKKIEEKREEAVSAKDIAKALIEAKADLNLKDEDGKSVLMHVLANLEAIRRETERQTYSSNDEKSQKREAKEKSQRAEEIQRLTDDAKALVESGADFKTYVDDDTLAKAGFEFRNHGNDDADDCNRETLFHMVLKMGLTDVAKAMIEAGANVNWQNKKRGITLLLVAVAEGNEDIAEALIEAMAKSDKAST